MSALPKTDQEVMDTRDNLEYLRRPRLWLWGHKAPLKHRDGRIAVAMSAPAGRVKLLVDQCIYGCAEDATFADGLELTPEQVVARGWEVD